MIKTSQGQKIDTIFVLGIFCAFAAMVLMVLMLSGKMYKNMVDLSAKGYDDHTSLSYTWSRIKNEDEIEKIYIDDFQGSAALCFNEEYNGTSYRTMIYTYDGWVRELFCQTTLFFSPDQGIPVIKAEKFYLKELENGIIEITTDSGSLFVYPRSRKGLS